MDWFTREVGPGYVSALAGRTVLAMGKGIARAPNEVKRAFLDERIDGMWTLSVVLVRWYAERLPSAEAKVVVAAIQGDPIGAFIGMLNGFRDALLPFMQRVYVARNEAQLSAAGVYFIAAVEQIGLRLLTTAFAAAPMQALRKQILGSLPPPADLDLAYQEALGIHDKDTPADVSAPIEPRMPPRTTRGERFDRADRVPPVRKNDLSGAQQATTGCAYPSAPSPQLASADLTRAYLHTLGWTQADVDRLLAGPTGKSRG